MAKTKALVSVVVVVSLSIGVWHLGNAAWIYTKAYAATFLIDNAWQATFVNKGINKPWSWADTWPVAEISVPAIGLNEIVLSGDSGASLAFGPGLSDAGASLESTGVKLISGHRDTHFSKLQNIAISDVIHIKTPAGSKQYKVSDMKVVDARTYAVDTTKDNYDLVLATCYPFNAIDPGGYERFIVQAKETNRSQ